MNGLAGPHRFPSDESCTAGVIAIETKRTGPPHATIDYYAAAAQLQLIMLNRVRGGIWQLASAQAIGFRVRAAPNGGERLFRPRSDNTGDSGLLQSTKLCQWLGDRKALAAVARK